MSISPKYETRPIYGQRQPVLETKSNCSLDIYVKWKIVMHLHRVLTKVVAGLQVAVSDDLPTL